MPFRFCSALLLLAATTAARLPEVSVVDTDGNPVYAESLAEGQTLVVTAPGFLPWSGRLQASVAGAIKVVLLRPAIVRGRVVADGVGLAGARVRIRGAGEGDRDLAATTSDSRGIFELKGLPPAALRLAVAADHFLPTEQSVAPAEGETRWVEVAPRRAATLRLKVTGPDGRPVQSAEARIRTKELDGRILSQVDRRRLARLQATSDGDGRLALGPLYRGLRHRIVLRRDGLVPQSIIVMPEAEVIERDVALQRAGVVRMTLRDREERPIAGALAEPRSDDVLDLDLLDAPEPSGPGGVLILRDLPAGTYVLRVHAPGFRPATLREVEVRPGRTSHLGFITLVPGAGVAGRIVDEAGSPVRGAGVRVFFYEEGRRLTVNAESDIEGRFLVSGLPDEEVELQVDARGFFPETLTAVRPGSEEVRVHLSRPGSISGRVFDARTGLPVPVFSIDIAPRGKNGWVKGEGWRSENTHTDFEDPEGRFEVTGLRPQNYALTVSARGYSAADTVEVVARDFSPEPIAVPLEAGCAVEGQVLDAETGAPVTGAAVRTEDGGLVLSDIEGRFRLGGLAGRTALRVEHSLYVTQIVRDIDPDTAGSLEIQLARGGSVEGTIYGRGGAPLPGAEVLLQDDGRAAIADTAGHYRLDGVSPGDRVLRQKEVPGVFEGSRSAIVTVRRGETTIHDFGGGVSLYGVVTSGGSPASGALLTLVPSGSNAVGALAVDDSAMSIRAREDGLYEVRGLRPGTYGLTLVWEGRTIAGRQATLEEGNEARRLDLEIPDLWLGGAVVDPDTGAGVSAVVSVAKLNGPSGGSSGFVGVEDGEEIPYSSFPQAQSETNESGRFRIPLMEPGIYTVSAFAEGYTMEQSLEVDVEATRDDLRFEMSPAIMLVVKATDAATGAWLTPRCVSFFTGPSKTTACGAEAMLDFLRPGDGVASAYVQGYAPGYQNVKLRDKHHEVAISLSRGGTLRLLLPLQIESVDSARQRYGLSIENTNGIDILLGSAFDLTREEEPAIRHVPAEHLRVRIGGGVSGLPEKSVDVNVPEGAEAVADLR